MSDERAERCDACRFWKGGREPNTGHGMCLRFPPSMRSFGRDADGEKMYIPIWTESTWEDWCGEFAPKTHSLGIGIKIEGF